MKKILLIIMACLCLIGCNNSNVKNDEPLETNKENEVEDVEPVDTFDINNYPTMKEHMNEIEKLLKKADIEGNFEHSLATYKGDDKKYDKLELTFNDKTNISITFNKEQEVRNISITENHKLEKFPSLEFHNALLMILDYSGLNLSEKDKDKITSGWTDAQVSNSTGGPGTNSGEAGNCLYSFFSLDSSSSFFLKIEN